MLDDVKELELVEDQTLAENGCILESQFGDLDLGIDSQIGAIRAALTPGGLRWRSDARGRRRLGRGAR